MGVGNVIPSGVIDYELFYLDYDIIYDYYGLEYDDYDMFHLCFNFFKKSLWQDIREKWNSFRYIGDYRYVFGCQDESYVLCKNNLVNIEIKDNLSSMMIAVVVTDDKEQNIQNLAFRHIDTYYKGLIDILIKKYGVEYLQGKLRYRTGPWTSKAIDLKAYNNKQGGNGS